MHGNLCHLFDTDNSSGPWTIIGDFKGCLWVHLHPLAARGVNNLIKSLQATTSNEFPRSKKCLLFSSGGEFGGELLLKPSLLNVFYTQVVAKISK